MGRAACAFLLLASCFCSLSARTRATRPADLFGVVLDEDGAPVADAQITLEDNTGHIYRATSDATGRFALHNLAAGDYRAEIRKGGFFVLNQQHLELHEGGNDLSLVLNHEQEIHDQVQVTAPAHEIDPQDASQHTVLTSQEIRDIPVPNPHVLQRSLVTLPDVLQDNRGGLHVAGARPGDTQYLLDGFEIADPATGALTSRFNVDAARMAEVRAARVDSTYAHPGASILGLETPDGDDRWRFGTTNPLPGINLQEGTHLGNWYPRFTFSGPIERGRFWFSDSISAQHTFAVVREQPAAANTSVHWAGDNLARFQYNISARHILHANFLYNRAHDDNLGLDALDPQSTTLTGEQRRTFTSLKDQLWLHETLVEFGVAADSSTQDYTPQGTAPYVLLINGTSGNYFQRLRQRARRVQATASVTATSCHWHGTHQISGGLNATGLAFHQQAERGEIDALRAVNAIDQTPCVSATPGCLVRRSTFAGSATPQVSNTQAGFYVQDNWQFSRRLLLQAGARVDWDRFSQSSVIGPRLAANLLPFNNNQAKFSLGWGIYSAPVNLALIAQAQDQQQLDTFDNAGGGVIGPMPIVSRFALSPDHLQQPRFAISSAGWQQKLGSRTLVGLELLARNGSRQPAYVDLQPTQPGGVFLLQDRRKDRYRALTLSVRHSFSQSSEIYTAFVRSRSHSNQVLDPALGSIFYAPQQPGPVSWDAPNRMLVWGWAPTHIWKTHISYFFEYRTGYPFTAVNLLQQLAGAPNSLRFPNYFNLNIGLERKFTLRGYLWAARVEAVDVFDRQNPDTVVNNVDAPNFKAFSGGQSRAFTLRIRFVGRK